MKPITAIELQEFIGKKGKYKLNGLTFGVVVANARTNYNILEFLIHPTAGEGESWVGASFITLDDLESAAGKG